MKEGPLLKKQILTIICILSVLISNVASYAEPLNSEDLQHQLNVEMINFSVPGVMASVVKNGEVIFKGAVGVSNTTTNALMDTNLSIVQTGSISKVFTSYALLKLLNENGIDFEETIREYLPSYLQENEYISSLTFKNLLTHTTGLATLKSDSAILEDPIKSKSDAFDVNAEKFFNRFKLKPVIEKDKYTLFSNVGYIIAGLLIETLSEEHYEHFMSEKILRPLGMDLSADILRNRPLMGASIVQNYSVFGGQRTPLTPFKAKYLPSDDLLTTVDEMTLFMQLVTSESLSDDIADAMFTRQIANNTLIAGRSYGFSVVTYGGYETYIHDGGIPGANSRLMVIPEMRVAVFITYNSNNLEAREQFTDTIFQALFGDYENKNEFLPYAIEDYSKYAGVYSPVNASTESMERLTRIIHQIRIKDQMDGLVIAESLYKPISETIFYSEENDNFAEYRTNELGQLEYLIVGNTIYERTPFFQSVIVEATMLFLLGLTNVVAWLIIFIKWQNMKVNRIHDTPRIILLIHTFAVSGVLAFVLVISASYDIWDVIYGISSAVKGTRVFGLLTLILSFPAFVMISRAKQDFRWSPFMIIIYKGQILLSIALVVWLFIYNLI